MVAKQVNFFDSDTIIITNNVRKRKTIISAIELGPDDLFLALGSNFKDYEKIDIPKLKQELTNLRDENLKQKEYIKYLKNLLDNKENQIRKLNKTQNSTLKIKDNAINLLISTLAVHNIKCDKKTILQTATQMLQN